MNDLLGCQLLLVAYVTDCVPTSSSFFPSILSPSFDDLDAQYPNFLKISLNYY